MAAGALAQFAGLPAGWLVGPMFIAVFLSLARPTSRPEIPVWARRIAQAVVGCVLASNFSPAILPVVARDWPAVTLAVGGTMTMSLIAAFLLYRFAPIDERTARLGVLPGAASGMLAMSDAMGADARLVALMQYGRVVLVIASATVVASFGAVPDPSTASTSSNIPGSGAGLLIQGTGQIYALTGLIALVGMVVGARLALPAGALLGPLLIGIGLEEAEILHVGVPGAVSSAAYALIGIYVGLLFDRASLVQAWRLLPYILISTLALMASCAGFGWILMRLMGVDYLTAYLATTPGAIDSVAIMAVDSGAESSLVLAVQMLRLLCVVLLGAALGRRWSSGEQNT